MVRWPSRNCSEESSSPLQNQSPVWTARTRTQIWCHFNCKQRGNYFNVEVEYYIIFIIQAYLCLIVLQTELQEFKNKITALLENPVDLASIIKALPFPQCSYVLSVYYVEILRIQTVKKPSLRIIFEYLCEPSIQKDKLGLWDCISWCVKNFIHFGAPNAAALRFYKF